MHKLLLFSFLSCSLYAMQPEDVTLHNHLNDSAAGIASLFSKKIVSGDDSVIGTPEDPLSLKHLHPPSPPLSPREGLNVSFLPISVQNVPEQASVEIKKQAISKSWELSDWDSFAIGMGAGFVFVGGISKLITYIKQKNQSIQQHPDDVQSDTYIIYAGLALIAAGALSHGVKIALRACSSTPCP